MNITSNSLISMITDLLSSLFSSIDNSIYSALDSISFIDNSIINSPYLEKIMGTSTVSGILMIANSLLIGFLLYYTARFLLSNFSLIQNDIQSPIQFIIKLVFIGILMNSSFFLCEQIISLNGFISSAIREVGSEFLGVDICFSNLINILNSIISIEESGNTFFSIDGIIKTISSIGFINLIFIYSIRYILVKVFVLISPFAILCSSNHSTFGFFKSWIKCFISLLFMEIFSSLILIVMFSIEYSPSDIVSKILFVGSIFALMKSNNYVREFLGGISLDIQDSMYALRSFSKFK